MSPTLKFVIKAVGVGVYGFLVSLQASRMGGNAVGLDQIIDALIAGGLGGLGFTGLAATPLENPGKK